MKKDIYLFILIVFLFFDCTKDKNPLISSNYLNPNNICLAYQQNSDIYLLENGKASNLTEGIVDTSYWTYLSKFSNDGSLLLFTLDYLKPNLAGEDTWCKRDDIFIYDLLSKRTIRLTDNLYKEVDPSFSPDGSKIVYISNENGNFDVCTINSDGSNKQIITSNPENDFSPTFSPDGEQILYMSVRNNNRELYLMNFDGSNKVNITNSDENEYEPVFLPNGKSIVYTVLYDNSLLKGVIYKLELESKKRTRLTDPQFDISLPKISLDGKYIICKFDDGIWLNTCLIDVNGNNFIKIGKSFDAEFSPDSRFILYTDLLNLFYYNILTKRTQTIIKNNVWGFRNIEVKP